MARFLFIVFTLVAYLSSDSSQQTITTIKYGQVYKNFTTNGRLLPNIYELEKTNDTRPFAVRIFLCSQSVTKSQPLSVNLGRGPSSLSTVLPRLQTFDDESEEYDSLGETLCEPRNLNDKTFTEFNETVRVSVSSNFPAVFSMKLVQIHNFALKMESVEFETAPSTPVFFRFSFPPFVDEIAIQTTSTSDICGRVTVQQANCPVFDTEGQVALYDSHDHQTFTRKAFILVKREKFGDDINIIYSVLPSDSPCRTNHRIQTNSMSYKEFSHRSKNITTKISPFHPNKSSIIIIFVFFLASLIISSVIVYYCYKIDNNMNPEDSVNDGSFDIWNLSFSQLLAILPVSLIVISVRYAYSQLAKDTDTCNFNFECSIPLGGFQSFNNMLSASSIAFAAAINLIRSISKNRVRRFFPLNCNIFVMGVLWTLMNICPQKQSYHLFTLSMLMTILEAKFLLVGMRVGRKVYHYIFTSSLTMILMFLIILDTNLESTIFDKILYALIPIINAVYAVCFSYMQGNDFRTDNTYEQIQVDPESQPADGREDGTPQMQIRVVLQPPNQILLKVHLAAVLLNGLVWGILAFWLHPKFDSTLISLRIVQTDFALYFLFYLINKWSPAASRTLNTKCICEALGMDYHDVIHYVSMVICILYPIMIHNIDGNLTANDNRVRF